jgi:hypothetical protein
MAKSVHGAAEELGQNSSTPRLRGSKKEPVRFDGAASRI